MLGIELSTGQKVQVGFVLLILSAAAYFIVKSTHRDIDFNVNSTEFTKRFGSVDDKIPVTNDKGKNPPNPTKEQKITEFAFTDGRMDIIQYPHADPYRAPTITFIPEVRNPGQIYLYYHDPMNPVKEITDPLRHALAYTTYTMVFRKTSLRLLSQVGMNSDQMAQQNKLNEVLTDKVKITDAAVDTGTVHRDLLDKVMTALEAYSANKGNPEKDVTKNQLAHKVLEAAAAYVDRIAEEKDHAIDAYIDGMEKVLSKDQANRLIALVHQLAPQPSRKGATPR